MTGWQRLGVVLAILFGTPAFLIAYYEEDSAYGSVYPTNEVKKLEGQEFWNALYRQAEQQNPDEYAGCIPASIRMQEPIGEYDPSYTITCDKTRTHAVLNSISWGLLPGIIIWIVGLTIGWIVAGFRREKNRKLSSNAVKTGTED